ncbi:MAG TPA: hypothetical protein VIL49_07275 [Capillimicrobium sp.]|jgi:hypothetical protein
MRLLTTVAGTALATLALAAPAAVAAQDGTGATVKVALKATIQGQDDGTFGGPVSGKPFGKGNAVYTVKANGDQQTAKYTATFKGGSIKGVAVVTATPVGDEGELSYKGTLDVNSGTGDFKGVKAKGLKVTGSASGGVITLDVKGKAKFPVTD